MMLQECHHWVTITLSIDMLLFSVVELFQIVPNRQIIPASE